MAKINVVNDILRHGDKEIIEFLADEVSMIRLATTHAMEAQNPEYAYAIKGNLEIVYGVLKELNRRNKEKAL